MSSVRPAPPSPGPPSAPPSAPGRWGAIEIHAKGRAPLIAAALAVGVLVRFGSEAPPPRTVEGVAGLLGHAAGGAVRPEDYVWEQRGGFWEDAFWGRRVLFLAARPGPGDAPSGSTPRDLYRARVRLTRTGRPISVMAITNLTETPLADERDLTGAGHHVAFATYFPSGASEGATPALQGVTVLTLERAAEASPVSAWDRFTSALASHWTVGSSEGLVRTEIAFGKPPPSARFEVRASRDPSNGMLVLALGEEAIPAALDFETGELETGGHHAFGAFAQRIDVPLPRGPALVAAGLEANGAFGLAARLRAWFPALTPDAFAASAPAGSALPAAPPSPDGWPPPPIAPPHAPFGGEGAWIIPARAAAADQNAPPALLHTTVRPDPRAPEDVVHVTVADTRRLAMRIVPGTTFPAPLTGPHGSGQPERSGVPLSRVVAAFAIGPSAAGHRSDLGRGLGAFAEGRILAAAAPVATTLLWQSDGGMLMDRMERAALTEGATGAPAWWQGADAMEDDADDRARVRRSAICRTKGGHFAHVSGTASRAAIRLALEGAECASAMEIGAGAMPLGIAWVRPDPDAPDGSRLSAEPALAGMEVQLAEGDRGAPLAIGYLFERDAAPPRPGEGPGRASAGLTWSEDKGAQPDPTWMTGVWRAQTEKLGVQVTLWAFLPGRAAFRLRVGADEPGVSKGAAAGPDNADRGRALVAIGMSVARRNARRGLIAGGAERVRPGAGQDAGVWLVLEGTRPRLVTSGGPPPSVDATELPLVAGEGKILPAARDVGTRRPRAALCVLDDGTVLASSAVFDTDEATAEALLDAGCEAVVALDRGAHDGVFFHRREGADLPDVSADATVLYVLPAPYRGTFTGR